MKPMSVKRKSPQDMLLQFQSLAIAQGGQCLEETYLGLNIKHQIKCSDGHIFRSSLVNLKRGSWCMQCKRGSDNLTLLRNKALKSNSHFLSEKCITDLTHAPQVSFHSVIQR